MWTRTVKLRYQKGMRNGVSISKSPASANDNLLLDLCWRNVLDEWLGLEAAWICFAVGDVKANERVLKTAAMTN